MNYFLLAETDFFRLINEAGDCNMETAYTAFATQVIELCNGGMDMNLTVIALAYIEIELQHHPVRNLSEEKREIAAYVSKALSFVRKMQKFLATPQVPPLISANNVYIIIAQRERYESFSAFLNDTIGVHSIDKIHFEIDRASLDLWRENTVSYYMRELAGRISPDGTLTLDQLNPNDDEALTMFNNLSSARSLISQLNITFNGNVDSQYLSEGEKKLMVVLFILEVISDERSLVLLDEPDSHLHVARKPQLVTMFKNAINRENVLTSHSPSLTAHFEDDSIIMLDRTADGHAQVVDTDKQRVVAKLTEGQWSLQQQNIFLESTDDIILVEGETDELFLKKALSVLQEQGHFLGKRYEYLPCGGAGGVELLKEHFQPKANQSIFCFFDSDQAGWKSINNIFGKTGNASYNSTNFQRARKSNNIWVAPYPKGKSRFTEFNIEDYLGRRILMRYVLRARSLNGIMTKDAIKRAMSRDCENGAINDKYFLRFAAVFQLIEDIKTADAAGSDVLV